MGILEKLFKSPKNTLADKIIKRFYSDYPEPPYISPDRPSDWIERAELFPSQALVAKSMMKRYKDGLLPGHVYMLYWLNRYTNKKVPSYFEYKYGLDFEKEKLFLLQEGFLNDCNKPTEKGQKALKVHSTVIEKHSSKSSISAEEATLKQLNSLKRNGFSEYIFISNRNCCEICAALNQKHFLLSELKIGTNAPPMHSGCSCSIAAYEDSEAYEAWLASLS